MAAINNKIETFKLELISDLSKIKYYSFDESYKPTLRVLNEETELFEDREFDAIANGIIYSKNIGTKLEILFINDLCELVDFISTDFKI